jgi:hypothetical protein
LPQRTAAALCADWAMWHLTGGFTPILMSLDLMVSSVILG